MAAWGYEFLSSSAESISSLSRERYFQLSKKKLVSPSGHVISSISSYHFLQEFLIHVHM